MGKRKLNILISGSTGQLGSELQVLQKQYPHYNCYFKNRKELDLSKTKTIKDNLKERNYDVFVNAAAYTAVDKAEQETKIATAVNALALKTIAKEAVPHTKIIHVSSDYVYHLEPGRPLLESDMEKPQGVYAKTKLEGEQYLLSQRPDSLVIRTSWVYSSFGNNFVKTMLRLGKERDQLTIVADQLGTPTYARDLAQTIYDMIDRIDMPNYDNTPKSGIYNYSNLGLTDWSGFAKEIFQQAKIKCEVGQTTTKAYNAPAPRPLWSMMSKEKIQRDFHIEIPHWQKSLTRCLKELGYSK